MKVNVPASVSQWVSPFHTVWKVFAERIMKTDTQTLPGLDQIPMSARKRARVEAVVRSSTAIVDFLMGLAHYAGFGARETKRG
jgi:hypothetical protein